MNSKLKTFLKNSGYAVFSNLLSLIVSALVILILPRVIGVEAYGYWQLYLFYASYIGFLHFGWIDGIYLKYGGQEYEDLNKQRFFSQFIFYSISQLIIAIIVFLVTVFVVSNEEKQFILSMIAVTLVLTNLRFFIIYIFQTTNRIQTSSHIVIFDRLFYLILLMVVIFSGFTNYRLMIYADVLARLLSLIYGIFLAKSILVNGLSNIRLELDEIIDNIKVGSQLMMSNVASMLIIGIVRLGIEHQWDVEIFGKVSLSLSISNLVMTFINAIGVVIFPMLKRLPEEKLSITYSSLRDLLMFAMLGFLLFFYPLKLILTLWLPQYQDSITLMGVLFPLCVFESKMALLINTYLKAFRLEGELLKINVKSMLSSLIITGVTTIIFKNLFLSVLSIVGLIVFRCFLAERVLKRFLGINPIKDLLIELVISVLFILSNWFLMGYHSIILYSIVYISYVIYKSKQLKLSVTILKELTK